MRPLTRKDEALDNLSARLSLPLIQVKSRTATLPNLIDIRKFADIIIAMELSCRNADIRH